MSASDSPESWHCPGCGAENDPGRASCWLCAEPVGLGPGAPSAPTALVPPVPLQRTFTLSSLFLVMTLIAVCLGVAVQVPGLGIPLAILCTPALIRTMLIRSRRRAKGRSMTAGDKVLAFLGSLAVVTTIAVAAGGAFVAVCFSLGLASFSISLNGSNDWGIALMIAGWVLGIGIGLTVGFFLVRWLWKRKDEPA